MGRNHLRFLVNFCYGLIINIMQISFVSVFWQFFQGDQGVKRITERKKKKREKEADFTTENAVGNSVTF